MQAVDTKAWITSAFSNAAAIEIICSAEKEHR
jgi:hypothetical protein